MIRQPIKRHIQRNGVRVSQGSLNFSKTYQDPVIYNKFIAQVLATYSDRFTCDIQSTDGQIFLNVPVVTTAGLVESKPYGILDLPEIDDWVIVDRAGQGERKKVIVGSFVPYLTNEYNDDAVNADNKQFSLKLLEEGKEKHYRRIFKSGSTFEVEEDGTIILEAVSGAYVKLDEANNEIHVEDPHGNIIVLDSSGVVITDANGMDITMASSGVTINGNLEVLS